MWAAHNSQERNKMKVTDAFLDFAEKYGNYENLPEEVVKEVKWTLLDGLGNALAGIASDKGKIGISMAHQMGGTPESTIIGVGGKVSAPVAAFANAELLNGLDMDPIPHIPPIVIPSVLAVAEAEKLSGKKFISSLAVGQEVGARLVNTFSMAMIVSYIKYGKTPDVFSNSNEGIIGAGLGNAVAMGLDREKMAHTIGISAYYCTLPACHDWESGCPKEMIKYAPVAWLAQGGVQAAMLARLGYQGSAYTLDNEYGFPMYNNHSTDIWDPEKIAGGLGESWDITRFLYKPYPCCSFIHPILDCFTKLLAEEKLSKDEIEDIQCFTAPFKAHPDQYAVANQIDVQFSAPYCFALVANNYSIGAGWQSKEALVDPNVREFMQKVHMNIAPEYGEWRKKDPKSWYGRIEVKARGQVYKVETLYPKGARVEGYAFTEDEMIKRFKSMANTILTDEKIERATDAIMNLEKLENIDSLVENICL